MSSDAALARLEGVCSRLEALEVRLSSSSGAGAPARWGAAGGAWVRRMAADASSSRCPRHRARLWDTTLIALVVVQWRDRRGGRCGISGCGGALCEGI